ncbi:MAG: glycoside hydrolase family 43 protein [Bacteroidota bacterium]
MNAIKNPILPGFHPDPSVIRVGEDYYLAVSTFEWFPGVQLFHSKDLGNWELIGHALTRTSQLDMIGVGDSCGVWAPCLSYHDGVFYLVFSNVKNFDGLWKDTPNYLVTTDDIRGEWSDPIFLSASGFDGSLFHDDDGRKWYSSMLLDHRGGKFFGGILLQEYDGHAQRLIGPEHQIFEGSEIGITEGPHIYKKGGYYHLITAEGGTEYGHAVTQARSQSITGPYEIHPDNPIITSAHRPDWPLQKAGHADIVDTPSGDWYAFCLVGRPLPDTRRCTLGRETAIVPMEWRSDGWLYNSTPEKMPPERVKIEGSTAAKGKSQRVVFGSGIVPKEFQSLRIPQSETWRSLTERPGYLRLKGQETLSSLHRQSLLARRVQAFHIEATTQMEFRPTHFQQMAGLVVFYNTYHWHYLYQTVDDIGRNILEILTCDRYRFVEHPGSPVVLPVEIKEVQLKATIQEASLQFAYATHSDEWVTVGPVLDASILSDDYVQDHDYRYRAAFTGMFVGMCCQDLTGQGHPADFAWFDYQEL